MGVVFGVVMVVWFALLVGSIFAIGAMLEGRGARDSIGGVILVLVIAFGAFLIYALAPQPLHVDLWSDRIAVDEGRRGIFPLSNMVIGVWQVPMYGVPAGTALHLLAGDQRFCLGGRGHRPHAALPLHAPPVERVDAYVTAAELDALLAAVPALTSHAQASTPDILRCTLTPNHASTKNTFAIALPWIAVLAVVALLGGIFGALDLATSLGAQLAFCAVALVLVAGGIALTARRAMRRPAPTLVVELDPAGIRVLDATTHAVLVAAPPEQIQAFAAEHTYTGRGTYTMPMVVLRVAGARELTLGVPDFRFSWHSDAQAYRTAEYVVGPADWLTLTERLGLRHLLTIGVG